MRGQLNAKSVFLIGLVFGASGLASPSLALGAGLLYGHLFVNPYAADSNALAKVLLKASVVGIGFGMNLREVMRIGRSGFIYTALGILFCLVLGTLIGGFLKTPKTVSFLITVGTAICGGSAIAAVSPIVQASDAEMAIALGTIFTLNAVALMLFPNIGWALHLSQQQFGLWSALAIHDTSSVVGASARYGALALVVGTTTKLSRALWIVPLSLATAAVKNAKGRIQWAWFIALFCLAAAVNTYGANASSVTVWLSALGKRAMAATLYLIGAGISRSSLSGIGVRPLLQGILLWIVVSIVSLTLILTDVIAL